MYQQSLVTDRFNPFKKKKDEQPNVYEATSTTQPLSWMGYHDTQNKQSKLFALPTTTQPENKPKTEQKQTPSQPTNNAASSFINDIGNIAAEQEAFLKQRAASEEAMQNRLAQNKINRLQSQIPTMQQAFDRFKGDTEASIADQEARAGVQKQNIEDEWGTSQRQLAQSRMESEARNRNRYAALNTTDSYGVGSYGRAQENMESDFLRSTNENLRLKAQQKFEVDQELTSFVRQAKTLVYNEQLKLNEKIQAIQSDISLTQDQRDAAILQAQQEAQAGVLEIKNYLAELKYKQAAANEDFQRELALEQAKKTNLSEEFMRTGIPQTQEDYKYYIENAGNYAKINEQQSSQGGGNQSKALSLVDSLINGDYQGISGAWRSGNIPILNQLTGSGQAQAQWEGLKNLLALAGRGQLKGSGAVSDFEAKMLEKAALAGLDPKKMSEQQFLAGLQQLRNDLMAGGATTSTSQMIRVKELSSGQTGTIPANEFDPSLYVRI